MGKKVGAASPAPEGHRHEDERRRELEKKDLANQQEIARRLKEDAERGKARRARLQEVWAKEFEARLEFFTQVTNLERKLLEQKFQLQLELFQKQRKDLEESGESTISMMEMIKKASDRSPGPSIQDMLNNFFTSGNIGGASGPGGSASGKPKPKKRKR